MKSKTFNPEKNIGNFFENYDADFKPFFETRVMARIENMVMSYQMNRDFAFRKIFMPALATLVVVFVLAVIMGQGISVQSLMGWTNIDMESAIASSMGY